VEPESKVTLKPKAKVVQTADSDGNPNGYLMELKKDHKGRTATYLTVAAPGCFKGYHLHLVRAAHYICLRGEICIVTFEPGLRKETVLGPGGKLHIPPNIPTGLRNDTEEEAWIVNFPMPHYDPALQGEQVEYDEEGAREWAGLD